MRRKIWFPEAALDWMVPQRGRVLNLGGTRMLTSLLAARGHDVFWAHRSPDALRAVSATLVAATPENLPFEPMQFDAITVHDEFATFNHEYALPAIARVLRPEGTLAVSALVRDDSVPWVRRLIALLRHFDPLAMAGRYGTDAIDQVRRSKYFPRLDERQFRVWQPISRDGLLDLVRAQPLARNLDAAALEGLLSDVAALYADSARPADGLMLPFQLSCWRARVAQDELTTPVARPEPGLRIQL